MSGLRPGEKLYEELLIGSSNAEGTSHPKIMKATEPGLEAEALAERIDALRAAMAIGDKAAVRTMLMRVADDRR